MINCIDKRSGPFWMYSILTLAADIISLSYLYLYFTGISTYYDAYMWLIVMAALARQIFAPRLDSFQFSLALALLFLFIIPTIGLVSFRIADSTPFLAATILIFDILTIASNLTRRTVVQVRGRSSIGDDAKIWAILIFISATGGGLMLQGKFESLFAFVIPYSVSLLYFERMLPRLSLRNSYLMLTIYFAVVVIHVVFYWSGFGRLMIGTYFLMPLFLANAYRDIKFRMWQAVIIAPAALTIAQYARYSRWFEVTEIYGGSAAHHLILTTQLIGTRASDYYGGFSSFAEQWVLLLLNWFPREYWSTKPIGVGLEAVDQWFGRQGHSDAFSVSLGMYGEQFFTLGHAFWIGLALVLVSLILLRIVILRLSQGYAAPVIVFDTMLISYVWGGCATFGSRTWFFVLPMLALIGFWRRNRLMLPSERTPSKHRAAASIVSAESTS